MLLGWPSASRMLDFGVSSDRVKWIVFLSYKADILGKQSSVWWFRTFLLTLGCLDWQIWSIFNFVTATGGKPSTWVTARGTRRVEFFNSLLRKKKIWFLKFNKIWNLINSTLRVLRAVTQVDGLPPAQVEDEVATKRKLEDANLPWPKLHERAI